MTPYRYLHGKGDTTNLPPFLLPSLLTSLLAFCCLPFFISSTTSPPLFHPFLLPSSSVFFTVILSFLWAFSLAHHRSLFYVVKPPFFPPFDLDMLFSISLIQRVAAWAYLEDIRKAKWVRHRCGTHTHVIVGGLHTCVIVDDMHTEVTAGVAQVWYAQARDSGWSAHAHVSGCGSGVACLHPR